MEALVEQRLPLRAPADLAEQLLTRDLVAVDRRDVEVVPGPAVEIHDDGLVAERLGDRPCDRREQPGEVALDADELRDLEEASEG